MMKFAFVPSNQAINDLLAFRTRRAAALVSWCWLQRERLVRSLGRAVRALAMSMGMVGCNGLLWNAMGSPASRGSCVARPRAQPCLLMLAGRRGCAVLYVLLLPTTLLLTC
jgi:hypothetical protein